MERIKNFALSIKLLAALFFIISALFFSQTVHADTSGPRITITPDYFFTSLQAVESHTFTVTLRSDQNVTLYPTVLSWDVGNSKLNPGSMVSYSSTPINLTASQDYSYSFEVTVSNNDCTGESYKVMAFSDKPYLNQTSDDPPDLLGIPITIDAKVPSSTANASCFISSSSSNNSSSGPISTLPQTFQKVIQRFFPQKPIPPKTSSLKNLFSKVQLKDKSFAYNLLTFSENISLKVQNSGNIASNPKGFIYIRDSQNNLLNRLDFANGSASLIPGESRSYFLSYRPGSFELGNLKAQIFLGSEDSLGAQTPKMVEEITFFYIPPQVVVAAIIFILIVIFSTKIHLPIIDPRIALPVTFLFLASWFFYSSYLASHKPKNTLGEGTINMNASVGIFHGMQITSGNNSKTVGVINNSPLGWVIYSITGNSGHTVASADGYSSNGVPQINLPEEDLKQPLLVVNKPGFK